MSARRFAGIAVATGVVTLVALAAAALGFRSMRPALPALPIASAAPGVSSSAAAPTKPSSAQAGHLAAGQISSTIDVPADATDVFPLPGDRIAVARRAALEVLDAKSGAFAFTTAELGGVRSLHAVGSVIYAVLSSRVAVVDPDSLRVIKWIDLRPQPAGIVAADEGNLALAVSPMDQAVAVIDTQRHAEIERFRFDDRLLAVGIGADGKSAVGAPGDPRIQRPGEDGVYVFDPSRLANGQPIKRVFVGDGAVGAVVAPGGTHAAVAVRRSSELVRVPLGAIRPAAGGEIPPGSPAPRGELRVKTCKEPETIALAGQSILVGCRGGRALAIHDAATLALRTSLDLGGPVAGLAVAPDGQQALVILRPPASGVAVIDLTPAAAKRVSIPDEITAIRYERAGALGTAFAARRHRVWVLR
jgi:DNA-binding beta-propeller fold protein YncE